MATWMRCDCGIWMLVNDGTSGTVKCDDCMEEAAVIAGNLTVDEWDPDDRVSTVGGCSTLFNARRRLRHNVIKVQFTDGTFTMLYVLADEDIRKRIADVCSTEKWDILQDVDGYSIVGTVRNDLIGGAVWLP